MVDCYVYYTKYTQTGKQQLELEIFNAISWYTTERMFLLIFSIVQIQ